jgi:hypothetical protein
MFFQIKCDPVNFNALKIFRISCLNLDFVAFSLLVKKCMQNMAKKGLKRLTFNAEKMREKLMLSALKASVIFNRASTRKTY